MYAPFVLITFLSVAQALVNLARPDWTRLRAGANVVVTATWIAMLGYVFQAGQWAVISDPASATSGIRQRLEAVNHYLFCYPLLGGLVGAGVVLAIELVSLLRRPRAAPQHAAT